MKNVLILGGTGYIGSALYNHLSSIYGGHLLQSYSGSSSLSYSVDSLYKVTTIDLEWFGNYVNLDNIVMDYRNLTSEQLAKYDVVVHLAAYSSPAICTNSGWDSVTANNIRNFLELLPKLHPWQKFIYASTIAVYQSGKRETLTEDHPLVVTPSNSYEFSKLECDRAVQLFPDLEYYGLRLATLSGISPNWRSDLMVNAMTDNAVKTSEVKVFNPDNNKPILYIRDLCRAIQTIIDNPANNKGFYNLASYNGITEEIAEAVVSVTNSKLTVLDSNAMQASGLPTTAYDFIISSKKFEETFNFKFEGETEGITKEIVDQIAIVHASKRIDGKDYR